MERYSIWMKKNDQFNRSLRMASAFFNEHIFVDFLFLLMFMMIQLVKEKHARLLRILS